MTFVFAVRCNDGMIVAGDTRVVEGDTMLLVAGPILMSIKTLLIPKHTIPCIT